MIIKRNFNLIKIFQYIAPDVSIALVSASTVYLLFATGTHIITLPFAVSAILGSALAIFIAFRNNTSYSRWWEARTLWSGILSSSRIFSRQIIANADNAVYSGKATKEKADAYKREMIYRQIAFAHSLRLYLRNQAIEPALFSLLNDEDKANLAGKSNKPNFLLQRQGIRIKEGIREEILGTFDNISLEPVLSAFNNFQSSAERIKGTPLLRQYDYYTRLFLRIFIILLPFSLIGEFSKLGITPVAVPVSLIISFVFATLGKVGEVNEDPFENKITDVPMTYICNTIERDLKEMLEEKELPEKVLPEKGFIY
ncbi:MAG: hydrogenase [Ignavibacteriaceae bacterium]|nr:hydrogenase [Ignavibacteriaceae bacterium]